MVVASFSSDAPPSACSAYSSTRSGRVDSAMSVLLCFGGCGLLDCLQLGGTGAVLGAVPVVVLVLGERLHVVRDRGEVGEWLDRERGTLTPRHGERDGDRLVDVRDVGNPQPAHLLAAVAHAGVAVDREPTPGPLRGVRAPCRREHPADALSGLERLAGELHQLDVHGLLDGAPRNLRDRYRLWA